MYALKNSNNVLAISDTHTHMCVCVAMMMMMGHALYMCIIATTREGRKKSIDEHAQSQMYVFEKNNISYCSF